VLQDFFQDRRLRVLGISPRELDAGRGIIGQIAAIQCGDHTGPRGYAVQIESRGGKTGIELVVKTKPRDEDMLDIAEQVAGVCSKRLGRALSRFPHATGLIGGARRECAVYGQRDPRLRSHSPMVYGLHHDNASGASLIVLERLTEVELMDAVDDVSGWDRAHIEAALTGIAAVHAIWYRREPELMREVWLGPVPTVRRMVQMVELWEALAAFSERWFADWVPGLPALQRQSIDELPYWSASLEAMPRTLIHNDFNPRNIAFRRGPAGPRLCAYDWELATLGLPQHDLAELLCFVLQPEPDRHEAAHYVELHRRALQEALGYPIDRAAWLRGFVLALADLMISRLPMYAMVHSLKRQSFLPRVVATCWGLHRQFSEEAPARLRKVYA
jgi:hypothetical protein